MSQEDDMGRREYHREYYRKNIERRRLQRVLSKRWSKVRETQELISWPSRK